MPQDIQYQVTGHDLKNNPDAHPSQKTRRMRFFNYPITNLSRFAGVRARRRNPRAKRRIVPNYQMPTDSAITQLPTYPITQLPNAYALNAIDLIMLSMVSRSSSVNVVIMNTSA